MKGEILSIETAEKIAELEKYKLRNEKAIEFVKECCYYPSIDSYIDGGVYGSMTSDEVEKLLNILQGSDINE